MIQYFPNPSTVKIITRLFGGLGNQLFGYAAARRLSLVNNAELVIDDISGFESDTVYQRHSQLNHFNINCRKATPAERLEPLSRARRYLLRKLNQHKPFEERTYIVQEGVNFDQRLLKFNPQSTVYLEGYWQSEEYFKDVEAVVRADLRITPPTDPANLNMARRMYGCKAVAVHVRFFDEPHVSGINNISGDYYTNAIEIMEQHLPDAHYFIFSDKPQIARACISLPDERVTLVGHNQGDESAHADLWLMGQCSHFIIANSTFSWWGAWLAEKDDTLVISPGCVNGNLTAWGFSGNLPSRWKVI